MIGCAAALAAGLSYADTVVDQPDAKSAIACVVEPPAEMRPIGPAPVTVNGATVRVALSFIKADAPPEVTVFFTNADQALTADVVRFARLYRLPCLGASAKTLDAVQEFDFAGAGRKRIWYPLRDRSDAPDYQRCLVSAPSSEIRQDLSSEYTGQPFDIKGNVLTRQRFTAPDRPPRVEILYDGGNAQLARAGAKSAERNRLPCLPRDAPTFVFTQTFVYDIDVRTEIHFKSVSLREFLQLVDHLDSSAIRFDLSTMGCPFAVRLGVTQPYAENQVTEVGESDVNRVEFIEWLKTVHLKLSAEMQARLIGTAMKINIPCTKVDLTSS